VKLKTRTVQKKTKTFYDPERDGVTYSLLSTFLDCRYKARFYLQGWSSKFYGFALVFGGVTHKILEWVYDDFRNGKLTHVPTDQYVKRQIRRVEKLWHSENPTPVPSMLEHIELTLLLLEGVLPIYFQYWKKDFESVQWERVETVFNLPFTVTSRDGVTMKTRLRGKVDGSYRLPRKRSKVMSRPWLFETKTKSRMNESTLADILPFDTQANIYLGALRQLDGTVPSGLLYNIIRRPGLRQKKGESLPAFATRVKDDVAVRPDFYFVRMEVSVTEQEMDAFREGLSDLVSDFLLWWKGDQGHYRNTNHCENKFGTCPFIGLCLRNDTTGYHKREKLFQELEEGV
jgi:hypothetical protein